MPRTIEELDTRFDEHIIHYNRHREEMNGTLSAIQNTQDGQTQALNGIRTDIKPMIEFFEAMHTLLKAGGFIQKVIWSVVAGCGVLLAIALTIKNILK